MKIKNKDPNKKLNIEKNKAGRPPKYKKIINSIFDHKDLVKTYAAFGVSNEDIANVLNIGRSTLEDNFQKELTEGRVKSKAKIGEKLFNLAVGYEYTDEVEDKYGNKKLVTKKCQPNIAALMFLAKTKCGYQETQVIENISKTSQTMLYLPDNGTIEAEAEYVKDPNSKLA